MDMTQEERRKELADAQNEAFAKYFQLMPQFIPECNTIHIT